jgi:hypothetical protein
MNNFLILVTAFISSDNNKDHNCASCPIDSVYIGSSNKSDEQIDIIRQVYTVNGCTRMILSCAHKHIYTAIYDNNDIYTNVYRYPMLLACDVKRQRWIGIRSGRMLIAFVCTHPNGSYALFEKINESS